MSRRKRAKEFQHCRKCGRVLSDPKSRVAGFGPTCLAKSPAVLHGMLERQGQMTFPAAIINCGRRIR